MEWVEVRGETVAEAEELALDQLGVAREDAEFEVVQEPENRWLGLKRVEARVRARVRPSAPPPKSDRGRSRKGRDGDGSSRGGRRSKGAGRGDGEGSRRESGGGRQKAKSDAGKPASAPSGDGDSGRAGNDEPTPTAKPASSKPKKEKTVSDDTREMVSIQEQQDVVKEFLEGLLAGFGLEATVSATTEEDDTVVGVVDGSAVGLLVGPRAGTLRAIQELARAAMQRHADGRDTNRLVVDVAGYRERRKAALVKFTIEQAQRVVESGEAIALEPMGSADRKIVHDAAAEIDGIVSSSAGEDPRRHVVLSLAD